MNEPARQATLAIIIVSYNVRELLRACLRATCASLARAPEIDATVWVVDNASADGSTEMVAAEFPQVRLVASRENLGFAGGNNLALRAMGFEELLRGSGGAEAQGSRGADEQTFNAQGFTLHASRPDLVLLLNPDAEPVDDAVGQMARYLLAHPVVGGAGAQLRYPDGRFQHGAFRFPGLLQLWFDLFPPRPRRLLDSRLNGRYPRSAYSAGRPFAIDFALGAALMVRRAAIDAAGLLDEGYFMYAEEVDWCWRIRRAGWPFYCVTTAVVIHHGGASTRQFRSQSFVNLWRSRRRLYDRFYGSVRRGLARRIVRLGMRAEARRAKAAAARGEITAAEMAERVMAAQAVEDLFAA
jgi:N-acetylglucosaminyl-diphospho-decaprenol L-rhamnosyltransferase